MDLIIRLILNASVFLLVSLVVPGFEVASIWAALWAALIFGFVNSLIRPILLAISLPLSILKFSHSADLARHKPSTEHFESWTVYACHRRGDYGFDSMVGSGF